MISAPSAQSPLGAAQDHARLSYWISPPTYCETLARASKKDLQENSKKKMPTFIVDSQLKQATRHSESHPTLTKWRDERVTRGIYQDKHRANKRALQHALSDEWVVRTFSKWALRHDHSDPTHTHTLWREGCANNTKMSTAPQRACTSDEGVARTKWRELRARHQDEHRATTVVKS
jgi:hypothetical protein